MKKLLILAIVAATFLTACGDKKDDTANSSQTQTATSSYTVDFEKACSDEAVAEVKKYILSQQSGLSEDELDTQLSQMNNFIKTTINLNLDYQEDLQSTIASMGGDSSIQSALDSGLTESYVDFILAYQTSYKTILNHMEENDLLVDGKDYFLENYWRAKHVLISTEGKSDEEKAEAKKKAEDVLARAEAGEDFTKMVEELSEDPGSKSQPDGYVFTTGEMVTEFEDGTKNTEIGKFTMVETSYGYHVIQRLAIDETPELYKKYYDEAGISAIVNEENIMKFAEENAN